MNKKKLMELRSLAHKLNPVVIIGSKELTQSVQDEIDQALNAHELIKIKVNARDQDHRKAMVAEICEAQNATLIQLIGHIAVVYRISEKEA